MGKRIVEVKLQSVCPCGTGVAYVSCCGRFLEGHDLAATAEQLMRSRYTAYVMHDEAYLRRTWARQHCPASLLDAQSPQWTGLKILRTEAGRAGDTTGLVEFVARYRINGRAYRLHEVSEFIRDNGRWLYVKGVGPVK